MMFWYGSGTNGWGYVLMAISMVAFWGLVIAAVFSLIPSSRRISGRPTPQQILAERFAHGEISEEEYRRHVDTIHVGPPSLDKSRPST
ncbi:SHOCT domain-containing protein [Nakamurella sp. PAMC28650]|uniref:SHOCT domain-containing protein n=1 Tax=Nakamurella sp. PAMC28650 TaxID=2762325 RepID=UPI00164D3444|nr:SHOCT domain-containing protein [Nakamurella sp. PAMC28650]QNK81533.1 SHOCT domain-containing protein [Nakamurella sp. PAMC28650]